MTFWPHSAELLLLRCALGAHELFQSQITNSSTNSQPHLFIFHGDGAQHLPVGEELHGEDITNLLTSVPNPIQPLQIPKGMFTSCPSHVAVPQRKCTKELSCNSLEFTVRGYRVWFSRRLRFGSGWFWSALITPGACLSR